jgi:predicted Fe-Mo cluster-binding NifX family protein
MDKNAPFLIAVPTSDGKIIFPKMLGMAKYFYVYRTEEGQPYELIEKRINPYETTQQHLKTLDVYEVISDCRIIIAALIGKKGITRLQELGMELFFRTGDIQEALRSVLTEERPDLI